MQFFNLEDAYQDYFAKRSNYPNFKNKYTRQSYRTNCIRSSYKGKEYANIKLDLKNKEIKLPKLGSVKIRGYRNLEEIDGKILYHCGASFKGLGHKCFAINKIEDYEYLKELVNHLDSLEYSW